MLHKYSWTDEYYSTFFSFLSGSGDVFHMHRSLMVCITSWTARTSYNQHRTVRIDATEIECSGFLQSYMKKWLWISFLWLPDYHKLGSLKQQKFIPLQFWRLEAPNQGVGRATFLWGSPGRWGMPSLLFPASGGCWHSLIPMSVSTLTSSSLLCLCLIAIRTFILGFRAHLDKPRWSPHLKILNLIILTKTFSIMVTFIGSEDEDMDIPF